VIADATPGAAPPSASECAATASREP